MFRRVIEDPSSAKRDWGNLFTSVCANGKRDLLVRLLTAGFRVPKFVTGCQSYLLDDVEMLGMLLASGMSPDLQNWQTLSTNTPTNSIFTVQDKAPAPSPQFYRLLVR